MGPISCPPLVAASVTTVVMIALNSIILLLSSCMCCITKRNSVIVYNIFYWAALVLFIILTSASSVLVFIPDSLNTALTSKYGNQTLTDCRFAFAPLTTVILSYILIIPTCYWLIILCWRGVDKCLQKLVSQVDKQGKKRDKPFLYL